MMVGLALFVAGSALCSIAWNFEILLAGRTLQATARMRVVLARAIARDVRTRQTGGLSPTSRRRTFSGRRWRRRSVALYRIFSAGTRFLPRYRDVSVRRFARRSRYEKPTTNGSKAAAPLR